MAFDVKLSITGLQEAQQRNLEAIVALTPAGALGRAIQYGSLEAHRYAVAVTHVDTGSLRASHRVEVSGVRGRIYIDPAARNPRNATPPHEYGVYEHRRGGSHAFYERVEREHGAEIGERMGGMVKVGVDGS